MADRELVSVVIPVFNGERFLAQAIESVHAQTHGPLEVIVVDDGSTDRSGEIARTYASSGVRYLRQDNAGQAAARNRGAAAATGPFLAFLDADDLWVADKLTAQMEVLRATPELDVVFGHAEEFVEVDGGERSQGAAGGAGRGVLPAQLPSAMLIRRPAFDRLGGFASQWRLAEVIDFMVRVREAGLRYRTLDKVVYRRRVHGGNIGVVRRPDRDEYLRVVAAALSRRRALRRSDPDGAATDARAPGGSP